MEVVHSDTLVDIKPDYRRNNPLNKLLGIVEQAEFALEAEHYQASSLQYLYPVAHLSMFKPAQPYPGDDDSESQNDKLDFQKQNIHDFALGDMFIIRGYGQIGDWRGPFIKIAYRGGPDSALSRLCNHDLSNFIKLWVRIGDTQTNQLIYVPYNSHSDWYQIELWGYPGDDIDQHLDSKGQESLARGEIQTRPDIIKGNAFDFSRENVQGKNVMETNTDHSMHPVRPLSIELAWTDHHERVWDSNFGKNHHFKFSMLYRGWEHFLKIGSSDNPHGGSGFLHYRNLFSNYYFQNTQAHQELGRNLRHWNFNAFGNKAKDGDYEPFFAVEYMDMHVLTGHSAIGLHRHRDNQEAFFLMQGEGLMIIADWNKFSNRERCFEIRTLLPGHLALLKGGQLHAFANLQDSPAHLFIFGGYD